MRACEPCSREDNEWHERCPALEHLAEQSEACAAGSGPLEQKCQGEVSPGHAMQIHHPSCTQFLPVEPKPPAPRAVSVKLCAGPSAMKSQGTTAHAPPPLALLAWRYVRVRAAQCGHQSQLCSGSAAVGPIEMEPATRALVRLIREVEEQDVECTPIVGIDDARSRMNRMLRRCASFLSSLERQDEIERRT